MIKHGLITATIYEGDLLYFPGQWHHEVHGLASNACGLTNAVKWPIQKT